MRLLLDTHCWLWAEMSPERLSDAARSALEDGENEVRFSAASAWEMGIKNSLGKLRLPEQSVTYLPKRMAALGISSLDITIEHALAAGALPALHRDPFDRMLVAQAAFEGLMLMTADAQLLPYDVEILWAGRDPMPPRT